ncbi:MAG: MotA/TolQ/ExbB proton channel family protein [Planctomycetota bacterium]
MTLTSELNAAFTALLIQGGSGAPDPAAEPTTTIGEFLEAGGTLMWPILFCSVLVLALTLERFLSLRRGRMLPSTLGPAIDAVGQRRFDEARQSLEPMRSVGANVLRAGMRRVGYPVRDVESAMEDQAHKELDKMRRNVRPIAVIGTIAPLLGLLGTVLGIAKAFRKVTDSGLGDPTVLAEGIEVALTTTIAGLFVAIPAVVLNSILMSRVRKRLVEVDEMLSPLVEVIAAKPSSVAPNPGGQVDAA